MEVIVKQKPIKKRTGYRKIALEVRGTSKAIFFKSKSDMRDFCRIVREMKFNYRSYKENGWWVWVE